MSLRLHNVNFLCHTFVAVEDSAFLFNLVNTRKGLFYCIKDILASGQLLKALQLKLVTLEL